MMQRLARSTRTVTLFPYTTLFRSVVASASDDSRFERTLFMTIFLVLGLFAGLYLLWLLFRLAVYALPVASGISLAFWMRDHDYGYLAAILRSEEHTSELQSLMRISYAVFCMNNNKESRPY